MPIKFSQLTNKAISETTKIIGLYNDETSVSGSSNCTILTTDFAKKTALDLFEFCVLYSSVWVF